MRVPCSTSNLGAGFDCVGLALERWLEARYVPDDEPLRVEHGGTLRGVPANPDNLIGRAFHTGLTARGVRTVTGRIIATSDIPIARGLGSSGAAIVAGLVLAAAAAGDALDREAELERAFRLEGHPDNAAPALFGGLIAVARARDPAALRAVPLPLATTLAFAFAAPAVEVATSAARAALPEHVPHALAARSLGRLAALLRGLETGDPELLRLGFDDELHVPYRLPLIPHAGMAIEAAHAAGAMAVTISGSGSGLIAVAPAELAPRVAQAMAGCFESGVAFALEPDRAGAVALNE